MEYSLELWLRGYLFTSETIAVPEFDDRMTWAENQDYRQSIIKACALRMKSIYHPQIDKCQGKYDIYLAVVSKMKYIPVDEDDDPVTEFLNQ